MTRRTALWLLGPLSLVLFGVLAVLDVRMQDAGGWGIIDFELAGSEERAREILVDWGDEGQDAARLSLWLDYVYLVAYGAFLALAAAAVRDMAARREWSRFARAGRIAIWLPIGAALFDGAEDAGLLLVLGERGGSLAPALAAACAAGKFVLLFLALLYIAIGLVRRAWVLHRTRTTVVLAALALALAALVVNAILVNAETEPAEAAGGQIVDLPGGDLHVSDEGAREESALVLIHGYACSMAWWEPAARVLAPRRRVIRVDLLGHGGSEKPKHGYRIEEQARGVLAAVRKLGVKRAVVAGHSLGGEVAVSAAEQDRDLVRGVVVIGTAPTDKTGTGPGGSRFAFVPVLGQALTNLGPDSFVKPSLQRAFADGVELPDRFVKDARRLTYTAFIRTAEESGDFLEQRPLDERIAATGLPLLAILGQEDNFIDRDAAAAWHGPKTTVVRPAGVGHSAQYEQPEETARLLLRFARPLLR